MRKCHNDTSIVAFSLAILPYPPRPPSPHFNLEWTQRRAREWGDRLTAPQLEAVGLWMMTPFSQSIEKEVCNET
jgi:hypothetical protein